MSHRASSCPSWARTRTLLIQSQACCQLHQGAPKTVRLPFPYRPLGHHLAHRLRIFEHGFHGAEGARTPDLLGAIQALSQLSYSPVRRLNLDTPNGVGNPWSAETGASVPLWLRDLGCSH